MTQAPSISTHAARSLSGGESVFHFIGFEPAQVEAFTARIDAIRLDHEETGYRELGDALLAPMRARSIIQFDGGVQRRDGSLWPFAEVHQDEHLTFGGHLAEASGQAERHIDTAFYGGAVFNGYGHMILQSIARITPFVLAAHEPVVFHAPPFHGDGETVFRGILRLLGLDGERIVFAAEPVRVRRLLAAEPGLVIGRSVKAAHVGFLREIAAGLGAGPADDRAVPIYMSRSRLSAGHRTGFGEALLEQRLGQSVTVAHAQELPLAEQIRLVNRGRRFIGLTGSQMHNLLFHRAEGPLDAVYLSTSEIPSAYFQIDRLSEGRKWYVNAADFGRLRRFGTRAPFMLDFAAISDSLQRAGFIDDPLDAAADSELEHAFTAAWVSSYLYHKYIRRILYCSPEERAGQTLQTLKRWRRQVTPLTADPALRAVIEQAMRDTFAPRAVIVPPDEAEAFIQAVLAD